MANSPAPALVLRDGDRDELVSWTRSTTIRAGLAVRARIVLLAAEGIANARIASEVGTTTVSVWKWRNRYIEAGLAGLADAPRAGRPKRVDDERIITATLTVPPPRSLRIAAEESPSVSTVRLLAMVVPPPVVWMPPELRSVVWMVEAEMVTVVPSP